MRLPCTVDWFALKFHNVASNTYLLEYFEIICQPVIYFEKTALISKLCIVLLVSTTCHKVL